MNKTEINYVKDRVESVVKCTNGKIATSQNRKKKGTGLTDAAKVRQIRDGRATLVDDIEVSKKLNEYASGFDKLFKFYTFTLTDKQKEKIAHNDRIDKATEEMQSDVELAGNRLVDDVVLGIIEKKDLLERLRDLATMHDQVI